MHFSGISAAFATLLLLPSTVLSSPIVSTVPSVAPRDASWGIRLYANKNCEGGLGQQLATESGGAGEDNSLRFCRTLLPGPGHPYVSADMLPQSKLNVNGGFVVELFEDDNCSKKVSPAAPEKLGTGMCVKNIVGSYRIGRL
ncbi:hypothetical protein B0J14DRAFT_559198 [Halenospora varia]|nr:hypothetical protein B0J14DRAFT_559198 [Halenospora varia]